MNRPVSRLPLSAFLALTAFTAILAACAPTEPATTDAGASASESMAMSSSPAMMRSSEPAAMDSSAAAHQSAYKDGTYTADGTYVSPAGSEQVGVTLMLADGIVTDAQFEGKAKNPASVRMQGQFSQGYKAMVVGKPIDELNLSVVNGSSLTPKGFMDAVAKIKTEAKA
jgi:uncharacterized protein with FMN-binding domain